MKTLDLDIQVGRRTVLTILWDENGEQLRAEKTARAMLEWLDEEGIHEVTLWSAGQPWNLKRDPLAEEPEWSQRQGALIHTVANSD